MNVNKTILLIVSGSIAGYKIPDLCRLLRKGGVRVIPVLSKGGAAFITPLTLSAVCEEKCYQALFDLTDESQMGHIQLARQPDAVVVAPASANLIAKTAHGLADDLPSTLLLATDKPIFIFPAMNPLMWKNAATQHNIDILRSRNIHCIEPARGDTACGEQGLGRMLEPQEIFAHLADFLALQNHNAAPLSGRTALVTAGGTQEMIDPVRFITNRSSGRQGFAIAKRLHHLGAQVTVLYGGTDAPPPSYLKAIHTPTADAMLAAVKQHLPIDIFIAAAAVADWKVKQRHDTKIKKRGSNGKITDMQLTLTPNVDILAWAAASENNCRAKLVIGFAAETENLLANAKTKLMRKNCDMLIANRVGDNRGFGDCDNQVLFLRREGAKNIVVEDWPQLAKTDIAAQLTTRICDFFDS